jgi:hypothetical protein
MKGISGSRIARYKVPECQISDAFDPRKRRLLLFCLVPAKASPNLFGHRRARLYTQAQTVQFVWAQ